MKIKNSKNKTIAANRMMVIKCGYLTFMKDKNDSSAQHNMKQVFIELKKDIRDSSNILITNEFPGGFDCTYGNIQITIMTVGKVCSVNATRNYYHKTLLPFRTACTKHNSLYMMCYAPDGQSSATMDSNNSVKEIIKLINLRTNPEYCRYINMRINNEFPY